ncbi:MAG: UDP-3-O-(3-hydroxymyristoyl)glucosamine N-acyltransferase [Flavobacteriales bacterium]
MKIKAQQIAELIEGEIIGNPNVEVDHLASIEDGDKGGLSFLSNPKYNKYLYTTEASIVIVNKDFEPESTFVSTLIKVEDSYQSFAKLLQFAEAQNTPKTGIEEPNFIHPSAKIGKDVYIGAFVYIGEDTTIEDGVKLYPHTYVGDKTSIGKDSILYAGVKIYHECQIANNCTIHSGAVIGSDGFGFAPTNSQDYSKIPQLGNVVIEEFVEIGANTTVDRATIGSTKILSGTKLDNLIQIAHNVVVGKNTVIAAQTGIAGSTKIGDQCMIGGQVAIAGHIEIGNEVKLAAKSGIPASIADKEIHMGPIAFERRDFQRSYILFKKLPDLARRIKDLEKQLLD